MLLLERLLIVEWDREKEREREGERERETVSGCGNA
jgi:hypothetical protein